MRDSEIVASIVAGNPNGLAMAYDRYADPLYKYSRILLGDPDDAAGAARDTFVIAAFRLDGLRDAERLRAWLYAVARGECLRTPRTGKTAAALDEAPDVTGAGVHADGDAERGALRILIEDAVGGMDPAARQAIELQLWQGLQPAEVAAVLGMSANHARALLSVARDQLQACLGVLLVGRAGRADCRELAKALGGWDGRLTPQLRKRVNRHIERCAVCTARRAYELRPAVLLGLSPGAAIIAAAAESLRLAPGPPATLKAHTLALAAGTSPSAIAHRAAVLSQAGSFGRDGFPKPAHATLAGSPPTGVTGGWRTSGRGRAIMASTVVTAVVTAAVAFALTGNSGHGGLADDNATPPASAANVPASRAAPSATRGALTPAPAVSATATPSPAPATTTAVPSPTATSATARPTSSPTPTSTAPAGTLVVSPPGGQLTIDPDGARITLVAQGGPVTWSITVSAGPGHVSVQPLSSGRLLPGARTTVLISASHSASGRQLTVSPVGTVFTIDIGQNGQSALRAPLAAARATGWFGLLPARGVFCYV